MCRRKQLQGLNTLCFALGLLVGHFLESGFLCCLGGFVLIVLGLSMACRK